MHTHFCMHLGPVYSVVYCAPVVALFVLTWVYPRELCIAQTYALGWLNRVCLFECVRVCPMCVLHTFGRVMATAHVWCCNALPRCCREHAFQFWWWHTTPTSQLEASLWSLPVVNWWSPCVGLLLAAAGHHILVLWPIDWDPVAANALGSNEPLAGWLLDWE